jgi:hypothetical protein
MHEGLKRIADQDLLAAFRLVVDLFGYFVFHHQLLQVRLLLSVGRQRVLFFFVDGVGLFLALGSFHFLLKQNIKSHTQKQILNPTGSKAYGISLIAPFVLFEQNYSKKKCNQMTYGCVFLRTRRRLFAFFD